MESDDQWEDDLERYRAGPVTSPIAVLVVVPAATSGKLVQEKVSLNKRVKADNTHGIISVTEFRSLNAPKGTSQAIRGDESRLFGRGEATCGLE